MIQRTVQIMNTEEDNNWKGKMNTPTWEEELVVELNSDILKIIEGMQEDLHSFKDDNINERKENHVINEALMRNMMGGSPQGQPTHSTNKFKKEFYHKRANNPKEEGKQEHTLESQEIYYHNLSSDNSLSPCKKKQRNDGNLQGEFRKVRAPTYEGCMNTK